MSNLVIQDQNQSSFLSIIDKVVSSPTASVDMLDKILDAQERVLSKQAEMAFNSALALMLNEIPIVAKTSDVRVQTKTGASYGYKYASLDEIVEVVRPILSKYEFSVNFEHFQPDHLNVRIICVLRHSAGHLIKNELILPIETSRQADGHGKITVQSIGATVSYGKRYTLCSILNIATGDDRDGYTVKADQANTKPKIEDFRLNSAIASIKDGKYRISDLYTKFDLTPSQQNVIEEAFRDAK